MSVGVRRMLATPSITISTAITMNVYGRRRASRTIHMAGLSFSSRIATP
jgi:hypothetical protein